MTGKRFLIIHPDRAFATSLSKACAAAGFEVETAFDSVQGGASVRTFRPDLLAVAVQMPGGGAATVYDFTKLIGRVNTRIVYLTDDQPSTALKAGDKRRPDAVLERHMGFDKLVAAFQRVLGPAAPVEVTPTDQRARRRTRVLVVDDEIEHCELIQHSLESGDDEPFEVLCVHTVSDACAQLQAGRFGCVLIDHNLPDGHGTDVLERSDDRLLATPVIGISTSRDPEVAIADFRGGCVEFIPKYEAFKDGTLRQRVMDGIAQFNRRAIAITMERRNLTGAVSRSMDELVGDSRIDALMGIPNRRAFDEYHTDLHRRSTLDCFRYVLAMIDVDHFKSFNDQFGHAQGDQALRSVAQALQGGLRGNELIARYGGEEIAVLLERADEAQASAVLERLRQRVFDLNIPHPHNDDHGRVTVSIGITMFESGSSWTTVRTIESADEALYQAKREGRNRVLVAGKRAPQDPIPVVGDEGEHAAADDVRTFTFWAQSTDGKRYLVKAVQHICGADAFEIFISSLGDSIERESGRHDCFRVMPDGPQIFSDKPVPLPIQ